ncbi:hypothetical protein QZM52_00760 [Burkholderia metallica]|uniref:Uncharacterized protein n=1 Tax=Burkholderia metallica TaxID=488729 RepID=A0ABT8P4D8_9BURK|nr:hypothetical protein [Burkholderia metallica]MDN7929811.1 hypothetical protein [Burkholderia metallica]
MKFNTDMPSPESIVMSLLPFCEAPPDDTACAPAAIDECTATADSATPKRRAERVERTGRADGRGRRFRFGDAVDAMSATSDAPPRPVTGSIAISFAVVSRRNWPR